MSEATPEDISSPEVELVTGMRIGEYAIEEKIGQGGFGTVYRAVHPVIGKVVAIKVLARKFSADPEMVSRFIAEARSVNQIRHRHIIDIFLFGHLEDGRNYYVMEYLDGEPLDARLDRDQRLGLADALPILRGIARALDAAHAKGVTHRDLKPENVFLVHEPTDEQGGHEVWPKLLDFGIAKLMGSDDPQNHKTRTGIPIGTPFYMSPEQCRGKDVDHRTDYYAFGVVAYQLLTGEVPLDADDYMTIMMRQLADEPAPPSTIVPELPTGVDDAIAWLMKKNRDDRPSSLAAAMRALEHAAEEAGIAVPKPTLAYDAVTPPSGITVPSAPKSPTSPPAPALAATMPSGAELVLPARRSLVPWIVAGIAVLALLVVVSVLAVMARKGDPAMPVPPLESSRQPAPPLPPAPQPARAVAPAAMPAPAPPATEPTPAATAAPKVKKPRPKSPDRDDIIDVFGKGNP
ncbi:MAG: serine/threonine-protein kinase [Kofleriaceae bacterium]